MGNGDWTEIPPQFLEISILIKPVYIDLPALEVLVMGTNPLPRINKLLF